MRLHLFALGILLQLLHLDLGQHALLDRVQIVRTELDVFELDALDDDHRVVLQRCRDGVLDRRIQRAALLNGLHRRVAAKHDLDLLVHDRADDLVDRGVEPPELCIKVRHPVWRGAQGDADLKVGGLLVVRVGIHLVPRVGNGFDADLLDAVDQRDLEAQAGLRRADRRAIAQPDAALGLIDCVPASCRDNDDDDDGDDGANNSPGHFSLSRRR